MWIAGKDQRVKRGGEYVWVKPGDPLPEAEHWHNQGAWERSGHIRNVSRCEPPKAAVVIKTEPKPKTEAPAKKEKALEKCPYCEQEFKQLWRHKCDLKPSEGQNDEND